MKKIEWKQVRPQLLWIFLGVLAGYIIFQYISSRYLKFILACVLISISILKFYELTTFHVKLRDSSNRFLRRLIGFVGGMGSASTGTGVCELHQPFYEKILLCPVIAANAAAIATEAWGTLWISALNLSWGMIDYTVLIWTGPGVFVGAQLGAMSAHRIPEKFMKLARPDVLIAAIAANHGLTVATRNDAEFVAAGVELFNPWTGSKHSPSLPRPSTHRRGRTTS